VGWPPGTIDSFFAEYLGCDLAALGPGDVVVAGSSRRYAPEPHYEHVFALWLVASGNRCAISVQSELVWPVQQVAKGADVEGLTGVAGRALLAQTAARVLGNKERATTGSGPILYCTSGSVRVWNVHPCRPFAPSDLPEATACGLYGTYLEPSVADRTCCVALDGPRAVSLSGTLPAAHMAAEIADVCVPGTLETHRRQGFCQDRGVAHDQGDSGHRPHTGLHHFRPEQGVNRHCEVGRLRTIRLGIPRPAPCRPTAGTASAPRSRRTRPPARGGGNAAPTCSQASPLSSNDQCLLPRPTAAQSECAGELGAQRRNFRARALDFTAAMQAGRALVASAGRNDCQFG
jgi:hypothetical protein